MSTFWAVRYQQGPRWRDDAPQRERLHSEHVAYQVSHYDAGRLVMGGPFPGEIGGLALFRAGSREEVAAITAADPAVAGGMYQVEIHEWQVALQASIAEEHANS